MCKGHLIICDHNCQFFFVCVTCESFVWKTIFTALHWHDHIHHNQSAIRLYLSKFKLGNFLLSDNFQEKNRLSFSCFPVKTNIDTVVQMVLIFSDYYWIFQRPFLLKTPDDKLEKKVLSTKQQITKPVLSFFLNLPSFDIFRLLQNFPKTIFCKVPWWQIWKIFFNKTINWKASIFFFFLNFQFKFEISQHQRKQQWTNWFPIRLFKKKFISVYQNTNTNYIYPWNEEYTNLLYFI